MKRLFIFILCVVFLMTIVSSAELTIDNVKFFDDKIGNYGKITIRDWFGLQSLVELELKENTDKCYYDCEAIKEIKLYQETVLINDIKFETVIGDNRKVENIKSYNFYVKTGEKIVDDYRNECNIIGKHINGSDNRVCNNVKYSNHIEDIWEKYELGTVMPIGTYKVKLVGEKNPSKTVDWIIQSQGKWITDWAIWGSIEYEFNTHGEPINYEAPVTTENQGITAVLNRNVTLLNITKSGVSGCTIATIYRNDTGLSYPEVLATSAFTGNDAVFNLPLNMSSATVEYDFTCNNSDTNYVPAQNLTPSYPYANNSMNFTQYVNYDGTTRGHGTNNMINILGANIRAISGSQVAINSPPDLNSTINPVNFSCNFTMDSATLVNASLWTNESGTFTVANTTSLTGTDNNTIFSHTFSEMGDFIWTCQGCDSDGDCGFANENRTVTVNKYAIINEYFVQNTSSGATNPFNITLETNDAIVTLAYLHYNNSNYVASITTEGNRYILSKNQLAPGILSSVNISFFWNFTQSDETNYATTSQNQTINPIVVNNTCDSNMFVIYNLSLNDEITQDFINGTAYNSSIKVNLDLYNSDRTTLFSNYDKEFKNTNPTTICIDNNLSGGVQYSMDLQIQYGASNYSTEYYTIEKYQLNTSSLNQNLTLYDLDTSHAQKFKLIVRDTSYLPIENALIRIDRKYIENGTFYTSEIPKADEYGESSASLQVDDVIYNFYIYQNKTLISSFTNVRAVCQTPLVTQCEIDFNAVQSEIGIPTYEGGEDFNFTIDYNETSRTISSQFLIPSGTPATVKLEVIKEDVLGTAACEDTLTSVSGTVSCIIPNSFGNATIRANLYKDNSVQGWGNVKLNQHSSDIFGVILIAISVLVLMTLLGIGISDNPVVTGLFIFIGVLLIFAMNLVENTGFIGATATILFLAIAIILVIIKASRRS